MMPKQRNVSENATKTQRLLILIAKMAAICFSKQISNKQKLVFECLNVCWKMGERKRERESKRERKKSKRTKKNDKDDDDNA